ncbi:hypothetical protein CBOM_04824 [Ceraceosorus bombacis]|uniref:Uncharacterized protein n=1 Tax=Ceraceosorus bombacis TaxID=401625 RepID=A0A0P1BQM9_9BASI|nr:hypothetical protein CBOM_04824 [Ceraceosorus bombacis]
MLSRPKTASARFGGRVDDLDEGSTSDASSYYTDASDQRPPAGGKWALVEVLPIRNRNRSPVTPTTNTASLANVSSQNEHLPSPSSSARVNIGDATCVRFDLRLSEFAKSSALDSLTIEVYHENYKRVKVIWTLDDYGAPGIDFLTPTLSIPSDTSHCDLVRTRAPLRRNWLQEELKAIDKKNKDMAAGSIARLPASNAEALPECGDLVPSGLPSPVQPTLDASSDAATAASKSNAAAMALTENIGSQMSWSAIGTIDTQASSTNGASKDKDKVLSPSASPTNTVPSPGSASSKWAVLSLPSSPTVQQKTVTPSVDSSVSAGLAIRGAGKQVANDWDVVLDDGCEDGIRMKIPDVVNSDETEEKEDVKKMKKDEWWMWDQNGTASSQAAPKPHLETQRSVKERAAPAPQQIYPPQRASQLLALNKVKDLAVERKNGDTAQKMQASPMAAATRSASSVNAGADGAQAAVADVEGPASLNDDESLQSQIDKLLAE